jgi:hypothetical protein
VWFTLGKTTGVTEGTQEQAPAGTQGQAAAFPGPGRLGRREDSTDTIFRQEPTQGAPAATQAGPAGGGADVTAYSGFTSAVGHWGTGDIAAVKRKLDWQRAVGGDTQKIKTFQELVGALQEFKTCLLIKPGSSFVMVLHSPTKFVLNTHVSTLDTKLYPSIPKWSLTYIQAASLPGYYKTRTNTTIHITNSHNFSNVLSTMRVFLVYLVQQFVAISNAIQHLQGFFIGFVGDRTMTKDPTQVLFP